MSWACLQKLQEVCNNGTCSPELDEQRKQEIKDAVEKVLRKKELR